MTCASFLARLPDELLIHIFSAGGFKLKNYVALSRVCRRLHHLASSYLYRDFVVSNGLSYKELNGFKKFGAHTRTLDINYTPSMLTADKAHLNSTVGFPKFIINFPNITKFTFTDSLGISFNQFLFIIRKTLVLNPCLKHAGFRCRTPARGVGIRDDIEKLLDEEMTDGNYAKLEKLVVFYRGTKRAFEIGETNTSERMEAIRRAVGSSMESVSDLKVFVTNYLGVPPKGCEDRWTSRERWGMGRVKRAEIVVDCWPEWEMGAVDLSGEMVEELSVGTGKEMINLANVAENVHSRFPNVRVLKFFTVGRVGPALMLRASDVRVIARRFLFLERVESGGEGYSECFSTGRKVFVIKMIHEIGGGVEVIEERV
ncbi:hypothetical protein TWF788_008811 [Orbilia oligospora]|uniref:F-box domain-containing protein n=1 Tax=Orbilia oligospora TaxID=2813651 RepID=A0A6G1LZU0_ORBOL|nr:hypothetical protein TWF788_008811 [Orbilia oligospora]KAF3208305.1 hypothetical protein TWF191_000698 [Orbilia oligospora]KAF3214896.1 hypothetical protein TWF679_004674 [Orbilia oligospora]KAF3239086.1 hypothetical protein TWF192_010164 [Orbilia oligospora]